MIHDIQPNPDNPRNSEGDTLILRDGRILLAWSRFSGREDQARADIYAQDTADWGRTWSQPRVLVSHREALQNVMSVSLLHDRLTGDALLFYLRKNGPDDLHVYLRRSTDDCHTWGDPLRVSTEPGYNVMNNARVVQTPSGRLLAPVAHCANFASAQVAICYISDDGGHTWRRSAGAVSLPDGSSAQEPGIVPLSDGVTLLMYIRTRLGYVFSCRSQDDGDSWSIPEPILGLPAPAAPSTIVRCPSGRLVALYNHREDGRTAGWADRTPLALAFSDDDGMTWARQEDIESSDAFCYGYTSVRRYGNKVLLTYYVWPRDQLEHFAQTTLRVRTFPAERFCDS